MLKIHGVPVSVHTRMGAGWSGRWRGADGARGRPPFPWPGITLATRVHGPPIGRAARRPRSSNDVRRYAARRDLLRQFRSRYRL
jgi:hypothetical protein